MTIFPPKYSVHPSMLQLLFYNFLLMMLYQIVLADATLVFKKKDPLKKTNFRPASVLPPVSKLFERLMQKQTNIKNHYLRIYVSIERALVHSIITTLLSLI